MISEILKKTKENKTLIGIRINQDDWDEILIGFIYFLDTNYIIIDEIDENANSMGRTKIAISQILRIDLDDRYQNRLKFIYDNRNKISSDKQITILDTSKELLKNVDFLIKKKLICTLYFDENQYITGIILQKKLGHILVKNIGKQGDEEGVSCYMLDSLIGLKYNGIDEQKITLLYKNWKLFYKDI